MTTTLKTTFFLSSDKEESLDALSDPESDFEQDADSDDHAAVRVLEHDGEFTLPRARGRGRGRAANRLGCQLAGRRGAPGAARVARAANRGALRGVARGGLRCRGRGRGVQPVPGGEYKIWEEEDDHVPPVFEFEPQREAGFHFPEDFAPVCEMDFSSCSFPTRSSKPSLTILMTTPTCIFLANKRMRNLMAVGTQHHPRRLESSSPFFCIWDWCV